MCSSDLYGFDPIPLEWEAPDAGGVTLGSLRLESGDDEETVEWTPPPLTGRDRAAILYTSGTTARPKGVLWTHANALWGARTCAVHETLVASDVHHVVLPTFHTNARTYSILSTMWAGGTVVLQPRFSASRFWPVALANRSSWMSAIPFVFKALLAGEMPATHHFRMLGASACDPPFTRPFGVKTIGWWGMTETISHGIVGDALLPDRPLATGRPAAG